MRALITGSLGFVGNYMREELEQNGYDVIGVALRPSKKTIQVNLMNVNAVRSVVQHIHPDVIIHLAGQASVAQSWKFPQETFEANVICAVNLMEAVRQLNPSLHMVLVGSSDQYGVLGAEAYNVRENSPIVPQTPYAVSKKAQEEIAEVYVRTYGLKICMTRSFNHSGAGQREGFLIPDLAAGVVRVERGKAACITVGNLNSRRDFTHVRDVVRAYRLIAEKGHAGEIYNVGSGTTYSVQEILNQLCAMATCKIPVKQDPTKMRPNDTPVVCCNHSKLTVHTGWEPQIGLQVILSDIMREWRDKL